MQTCEVHIRTLSTAPCLPKLSSRGRPPGSTAHGKMGTTQPGHDPKQSHAMGNRVDTGKTQPRHDSNQWHTWNINAVTDMTPHRRNLYQTMPAREAMGKAHPGRKEQDSNAPTTSATTSRRRFSREAPTLMQSRHKRKAVGHPNTETDDGQHKKAFMDTAQITPERAHASDHRSTETQEGRHKKAFMDTNQITPERVLATDTTNIQLSCPKQHNTPMGQALAHSPSPLIARVHDTAADRLSQEPLVSNPSPLTARVYDTAADRLAQSPTRTEPGATPPQEASTTATTSNACPAAPARQRAADRTPQLAANKETPLAEATASQHKPILRNLALLAGAMKNKKPISTKYRLLVLQGIRTLLKKRDPSVSGSSYMNAGLALRALPLEHGQVAQKCAAACFSNAANAGADVRTAITHLLKGCLDLANHKRLRRYYRHKVLNLALGGTVFLRTIAERAKTIDSEMNNGGAASTLFQDIISKAAREEKRLPLGVDWYDTLANISEEEKSADLYNSPNGVVQWHGPHDTSPTLHGAGVTWNVNGLRARMMSGDFTSLLEHEDPAFIALTEIKSNLLSLGHPWELRRALSALGYSFCCFNWCTKTDKNGRIRSEDWGTAFLSKIRPLSVSCGVLADDVDTQGRVITARFSNATVVTIYSPCSRINDDSIDAGRLKFDADIARLISTEKKRGVPVFAIGDYNVAPNATDCRNAPFPDKFLSSCKPWERASHARLKNECSLVDVHQTLHPGDSTPTWQRHTNWAMRIDLALASKTDIYGYLSAAANPTDACIGSFTVLDRYGSDHHALRTEFAPKGDNLFSQPTKFVAPRQNKNSPEVQQDMGSEPLHDLTQEELLAAANMTLSQPNDTATGHAVSSTCSHDHAQHSSNPQAEASRNNTHGQMSDDSDEERSPEADAPVMASIGEQTDARRKGRRFDRDHEHKTITQPPPESPLTQVLPSLDLDFNIGTTDQADVLSVETLIDTGAKPNAMSIDTAKALKLTILKPSAGKAMVRLANDTCCTILGTTQATINLSSAVAIKVPFIVLQHCPYPALLGWNTIRHFKGSVDANLDMLNLNVNDMCFGLPITSYGEVTVAERAVKLLSRDEIILPPHTTNVVPIKVAQEDVHLANGQWGFTTDTYNGLWKTARGVTKINTSAHHKVILLNPTPHPILITKGRTVAEFHRVNPDTYMVAQLDDALETAKEPEAYTTEELKAVEIEWGKTPDVQEIDLSQAIEQFTSRQVTALKATILQSKRLWSQSRKTAPDDAPLCKLTVFDKSPFFRRTKPLNPIMRKEVDRVVQHQLKMGYIEPSTSQYSSPVLLVPKPGSSKLRFCVDLTALNKRIEHDSYPLPGVEEILASVEGKTIFTALDLKEAFWSVRMDPESRKYTSFNTGTGSWQYVTMPMGLKTASAVFCRYLDHALGNLRWTDALTYIDDMLIAGSSFNSHLQTLHSIFRRLDNYGFTLGANKCRIAAKDVPFLGHIVDAKGLKPNPEKIKAIEAIQLPQCASGMRKALGSFGYYRRFCKGFSTIAFPLRKMMDSGQAWRKNTDGMVNYDDSTKEAFFKLRDMMSSAPVLDHPDWSQPFAIHTDCSTRGAGASLVQHIDGVERVIAYASRALTKAEQKYSIFELEALAIVWATRLWRMYLAGKRFKIVTDSMAARAILQSNYDKGGGRLMRWRLSLADFDYEIVHRKGARHMDADFLSRNPLGSTEPYNEGPTEIDPLDILHIGQNPQFIPREKRIPLMQRFQAKHPALSRTALTSAFKRLYTWPGVTREIRSMRSAASEEILATASYFPPCDHDYASLLEFAKHQQSTCCNPDWPRQKSKLPQKDPKLGYHMDEAGTMRRKWTDANGAMHDAIFVPQCLRASILRAYHTAPIAGHPGAKRTHELIQRKYWWKGMHKDVSRWVNACLQCKKRKTPRPAKAGDPAIICNAPSPWHTVAMDLINATGTTTSDGHQHILTATCIFTRWTIAVPLRNKKAQTIADALMNNILCVFGRPTRIITDDGGEFVNKGLQYLCKRWCIEPISTGGYQSQANPVERRHRNINEAITTLASRFGKDWNRYLQTVVFNYNITVCESTGFSPFQLMFGKKQDPLHSVDVASTTNDHDDPASFHEQMVKTMAASHEQVRDQQQRAAQRNQKRRAAAKHTRDTVYTPGKDTVLHWEPRQNAIRSNATEAAGQKNLKASWTPNWTGPHKVLRRWMTDAGYRYELWHTDRAKKIQCHQNKLCKFDRWSDELPSTSAWLDGKQGYELGGWAEKDDFIVLPLQPPFDYGVAKITATHTNGSVDYQWWGNATNNNAGIFKPGWLRSKHPSVYYSSRKLHPKHATYMGQHDIPIKQRDIVVHSFQLTATGRLPQNVIRALAEDKRIGGR